MKKNKDKVILFIIGLIFVTIFDCMMLLGFVTRITLGLFDLKRAWYWIVALIIPAIFFAVLLVYEINFLKLYFKKLKMLKKDDEEKHYKVFLEIKEEDENKYKKHLVFIFMSCAFTVLLGFIGLIPLGLMVSGIRNRNSVSDNETNFNDKKAK